MTGLRSGLRRDNDPRRRRVRSVPRRTHTVVAVVAHGIAPFELGVACEVSAVFGLARPEIIDPWPYEFVVCSMDEPPIRTTRGFSLS